MPLQEEFESQGNYLFKYRGVLPLLIMIPGVIIFLYLQPQEGSFLLTDQYEYVCLLVSVIGLIIRSIAVAFRAPGTSGRNTKNQVADNLNSSGIYSLLRHPLYLGNFFMSLGAVMLVQNLWFVVLFIVVFWLYYERIMYAEEQFLRSKYGEEYIQWASKTPAFIPSFKNWVKPNGEANWKVVTRNEINSIINCLTTFLLFEVIEKFKEGNPEMIFTSWIFYLTVSSFVVYGLVKLYYKFPRKLKAA